MADDINPMTTIDLSVPLPKQLDAKQEKVLKLLQGNILKGHGRRVMTILLLRFDSGNAARSTLGDLADLLVSASDQRAMASDPTPKPFMSCALSRSAYAKLGIANAPADAAFRAGMKVRGDQLGDPPAEQWDQHLRGEIDALVLIAGDIGPESWRSPEVDAREQLVRSACPHDAVVGVECGRCWFNGAGQVMEHFGFVDGKSQPLFFEEEIAKEANARWSPAFSLGQVLVDDPAVADPLAFGSYFVFRKLEQNVAAFQQTVTQLQNQLELAAGAALPSGFAAAALVGRYRDGTPLALQAGPGLGVSNDFNYAGDPFGAKCPFHAHVRKMNPRGSSGASVAEERTHAIARRGMTYGERVVTQQGFGDVPSTDVGLLFMAYQADIANQFEHIQKQWATDPNFSRDGVGSDPIVGAGGAIRQRTRWGNAMDTGVPIHLDRFVHLKGGEYFFTPSIAFFHELKQP